MTADDTTPQTSADEVIRDDDGRDIRIYGAEHHRIRRKDQR